MPNQPSQPDYQKRVTTLAREVMERIPASQARRYMLGITGGPGAGKSTFADSFCHEINALSNAEVAVVVPMDGFHKTNRELHALGMWDRKGEPETFDARGFVDLLLTIRRFPNQMVAAPLFDRVTDEPVSGALHVHPLHRVIVVEGNYLLLPDAPWSEIAGILDEVWYIEATEDVVVKRLEERHLKRGLAGTALDEKITGSDLKNASRIAATRHLAHRILWLPSKPE